MGRLEKSALLEVPPACAYDVVVDVLRYPEFLPGCEAVEILEQHEGGVVAKVHVAGKGVRDSFVTTNRHTPYEAVHMSLREGPFDVLEGLWLITPLGDLGCRIDMHIEYVPRGVLARVLSGLANRIADRMVDAFSQRMLEHAEAAPPATGPS